MIILPFKGAFPANPNPSLASVAFLLWAFVGRQRPDIRVGPNVCRQ
jgi:hypothetical protein